MLPADEAVVLALRRSSALKPEPQKGWPSLSPMGQLLTGKAFGSKCPEYKAKITKQSKGSSVPRAHGGKES